MSEVSYSLVGVTGLQNRGVEALVRPTLLELQKRSSGGILRVATQTPEYDGLRLGGERFEWLADPYALARTNRIRAIRSRLAAVVPAIGGRLSSIRAELDEARCVVATGGDVYSSDYGDFSPHLDPVRSAQAKGRKTVLLAQSIGPFRTEEEKGVFRQVAEQCDLITVRESASLRYSTEELRLDEGRVVLTADPGFLLEPAGCRDALLGSIGVPAGAPYVTLSISRGISAYGKLRKADHLEAWRLIAGNLLDQGYRVVLVAHVQRAALAEDDRVSVAELARALDWREGVHLATADFSAGEFKAIIGGAEFNLAERMHAAIAGLSQAVPTGVVGYSVKGEGILSDLYQPDALKEALLPVADLADRVKVERFVAGLMEMKAPIRENLERRLPDVKAEAMRNFDLIAGL